MKPRKQPLQAKSGLKRGEPLARGDKPLRRGAPPQRSQLKSGRPELKSEGEKSKPAPPPVKPKRRRVTNAEKLARLAVWARSGGTCEGGCNARASDWHHRKNRSQGGVWSAPNGLHLCRECHAWVTDHPEDGRRLGWAVRSHEDPLGTPCLRRGEWVWLLSGGGVEPLTAQELVEGGWAA